MSFREFRSYLGDVKVTLEQPHEGLFELLVGHGVADGVDGTVGVAEKVGEHVDVAVDAGGAEAGDDGEYVIWRPAGHEGTHDDGDGFECLVGPVL